MGDGGILRRLYREISRQARDDIVFATGLRPLSAPDTVVLRPAGGFCGIPGPGMPSGGAPAACIFCCAFCAPVVYYPYLSAYPSADPQEVQP